MGVGQVLGLSLVVTLGFLWSGEEAAAKRRRAPTCQGSDLIAMLAETDPVGYRRIVTRSAEVENSGAVFWVIEKEGLAPSYLLGTVHLSDARVKRLPAAAQIALQQAQRVAVETYFEGGEDVESVLHAMGSLAITSTFNRLSSHLSKAELVRLQERVKAAKIKPEELDRLNPWVAEMLIQGESCEVKRIEAGELVLDAWIAQHALKRGVALERLETVGEQFRSMASIPYASQIAMLRYALTHDPKAADDEMETMIGLYLRRQIPAADVLTRMRSPEPDVADAYLSAFWENLINRRNERFLANAKPLIEKGRVFIAVGAAHLPGPRGLVRLLRDSGYRVTAADDGPGTEIALASASEPGTAKKKARSKTKRKALLAEAETGSSALLVSIERMAGRK